MANTKIANLRGPQGAQGAQGNPGATGATGSTGAPGMVWRGAWVNTTAYAINDVVGNAGSSYICIAANTGNTPPNATFWSLVAQIGGTGPAGNQGPQGPQGENANTTTSASFTVPPVGQTVFVTVADAGWIVVGQMLYVDTAGGGTGQAGALQVTAKSGNQLTLLNPTPAPAFPLASSSTDGLLKMVSGLTTDYVGGDNACHALPKPVVLGGRLQYVSATLLSFTPFRGAQIIINGTVYNIGGGIFGLSNTNVYVNGAGGQNLAASTLYYLYCFNNSGTLTADFSTTGHVTSATAANVGTEIKSGDDTRTFIGLIYTNASAQFTDATGIRYVRSWVNRKRITFSNAANTSTTATTPTIAFSAYIVCFADEAVYFSSSGYGSNTSANTNMTVANFLDGSQVGYNSYGYAGTQYSSVGLTWAQQIATEGQHQIDTRVSTTTGTLSYILQLTGIIG